MFLSFSFFFLFPVAIISNLHCQKAFSLVSLISVSSSSFSNNMWISVYVSWINILDFCFYRKLEELLTIFPVKSRFWWVTWSSLFGSHQTYFLNMSSVTRILCGCLHVAPSISTKWNFLTSLCICYTLFRKTAINFISYWPVSFGVLKILILCITHLPFKFTITLWSFSPVILFVKSYGQLGFLFALGRKPWSQIPDPFAQVICVNTYGGNLCVVVSFPWVWQKFKKLGTFVDDFVHLMIFR